MNLRWLWLDHFPAGLELTAQQRLEAKKRAREHRWREPSFARANRRARRVLWVCILPLAAIFLTWWLRPLWTSWEPQGIAKLILDLPSPVAFIGLQWAAIAYAANRSNAPFIRKALGDMGMPVCIECGYILKGVAQESLRCPECGAEWEARIVGSTDGRS